MRDFIIDENFINSYLTIGNTYDNFLFENCPNELISIAKERLNTSDNETKSIILNFDKNLSANLQSTLDQFDNPIQKRIICRDLISSMFMKQLLEHTKSNDYKVNDLDTIISAIQEGNRDKILDTLSHSPIPYDIERLVRKIGKIEVNIFLTDIENNLLQQAINNYLTSRTPYSIKVFSNKNLCTFYDQMGNILQPPHDFLVRDVNKFITLPNQIPD